MSSSPQPRKRLPPAPAHHRLYGRAKGKALTAHQTALMKSHFPTLAVDMDDPTEGSESVWLEIGFGAAHHLIHQAQAHPDTLVIGAEPFINGVAKAVAQAHEHGIENLRLHADDARQITAHLADASLDRLFVLYPDPWPKARHNKRRLIQDDTIAEFARILKPGAVWRFVSDINDYVDWTLTRVVRNPDFSWQPSTASDFLSPPTQASGADWVETHFERKAKREGRTPHYIDFLRA